MNVIYCYDAYCNWCFGFSPVMQRVFQDFNRFFHFEVLSGGLILPDHPVPVSVTSAYTLENCGSVTARTGASFGEDYLWHFKNPADSDWYPNSEKPAIALCIFKELFPGRQVEFASDLLYALQWEGRDLCDDEAYRHLLVNYEIPHIEFYEKLHSDKYRGQAYEEFALVKQLRVSGFPVLLLQETEAKFHAMTVGYSDYEIVAGKLNDLLKTSVA